MQGSEPWNFIFGEVTQPKNYSILINIIITSRSVQGMYVGGLQQGHRTCSSSMDHALNETYEPLPMQIEDMAEHLDTVVADFLLDRFDTELIPDDLGVNEAKSDAQDFLATEAATPLYRGCKSNRLSIILEFMKVQARHEASNKCIDDIFAIIADRIIDPTLDSKMPRTRAEARKIISELGLDYKTIHSCPCDKILYYGPQNEQLLRCPKCQTSRYREDLVGKAVPRKVCSHTQIYSLLYVLFL